MSVRGRRAGVIVLSFGDLAKRLGLDPENARVAAVTVLHEYQGGQIRVVVEGDEMPLLAEVA